MAPVARERRHGVVQGGGHPVRIAAMEHEIVPAGGERDEVRLQVQGRSELLVEDFAQDQAADGKVCVPELAAALAEFLGDAVRPPPNAAGAQRFRVADACRERVAQGDIPAPWPGTQVTGMPACGALIPWMPRPRGGDVDAGTAGVRL